MSVPLARELGEALARAGLVLVTAESCTGGGLARAVTDVAGSSAWFDRGFVTYSDVAKEEMLGVDPALIRAHGAVSEAVVRAMAAGALARSRAQVAVAVSGVAGPGGGTAAKPVGTVCLAWQRRGADACSRRDRYPGDREAIRARAVEEALRGLVRLARGGR